MFYLSNETQKYKMKHFFTVSTGGVLRTLLIYMRTLYMQKNDGCTWYEGQRVKGKG